MRAHPPVRHRFLIGNLILIGRSPVLLLGSVLLLGALLVAGGLLVRALTRPAERIVISQPPVVGVPPVAELPAGAFVPAQVVRVVDGDTLIVALDGAEARLRLIGMDTPETVHPTKPVQCFGAEATAKTREILNGVGNRVWLEKDVSETDRYGRLLRYVWLGPDPSSPMLNEVLVQEGYAQVSTFPPDVKYYARFLAADRAARAANRGLWAACGQYGVPATPSGD
jgi:micrococcal nuclease